MSTLSDLVTFTRASGGTYVNAFGTIVSAANDVPRFDYHPITKEIRGILVEDESENLILYSNEIDNVAWGKMEVTTSPNAITSPDGTVNADKIVESSAIDFHYVTQAAPVGTMTASCWMKAGERTTGSIFLTQGGDNGAVFDLVNGTILSVSGTGNAAEIYAYKDGWFRCVLHQSNNSSGGVRFGPSNGVLASYQGDGTSGIYVWGMQLEASSIVSSYISTSASTVTRSPDSLFMDQTVFSQFYRVLEGTIIFEGEKRTFKNGAYASLISDGTNTNKITLSRDSDSVDVGMTTGTVPQVNLQISTSSNIPFTNIGIGYKTDDVSVCINGRQPFFDTSAILPISTRMFIGTNGSSSSFGGWIRKITYYAKKVTDLELIELTKVISKKTDSEEIVQQLLYKTGGLGVMYHTGDLSTVYQNISEGVQSLFDGDPIAINRDKSPYLNSLTQSVDIDRGTLRQSIEGDYYIEYGGSKNLIVSFAQTLGNCTVIRSDFIEGITLFENQNISTTFTDTLDRAGFIIINRILNQTEKDIIFEYLVEKSQKTFDPLIYGFDYRTFLTEDGQPLNIE